jgi:hypothetical protein
MNRIIVEIDNLSNVKRFISILEDLKYVRFFTSEKEKTKDLTPLTEEDWIKPGRSATDEEFEAMIKECEQEYESGLSMTSEQAKSLTLEKIAAWRKRSSR